MLTGFQLRASRGVLNLFTKDLAKSIGLHYSTLVRLEENTSNLSYLKCNLRTFLLIKNYFENHGITFLNKNSVTLKTEKYSSAQKMPNGKLTRFQLKTARVAMCLTQKSLGEYIGLSQSTISELEGIENNHDIIKCSEDAERIIRSFFLENGIIFPDHKTVELIDDPILLLNQQKKLFDIGNK